MPTRHALALFALLALPAAATAGPIEFSYTTSANTFLYPGMYWGSYLTFELTPSGNVTLPASGGSVEVGTVRLTPGSTPPPIMMPGPFPLTWPTGPTSASTQFAVFVTVTDAQGRSTELPIYSHTEERWVPGPGEGEWTPVYNKLMFGAQIFDYWLFGGNTNSWTTVLGDTEYTLTARGEENDLLGVYTLSAAPAPTAATPEPATLALAGAGLLPFAARLLRRRHTPA